MPEVRLIDPADLPMLEDVLTGLGHTPKSLPSKYFYDDEGSRLFDQITRLPEYYPTRTEAAIMHDCQAQIAQAIGERALLIEYGSGSSEKTRILLDAASDLAAYVPVDISGDYLEQTAARLRARYPALPIVPITADFTAAFEIPAMSQANIRRVVFFPGSTIGNFTRDEALKLLRQIAVQAGPSGGVLIGTDLVKPLDRLLPAYNDAQGVTARFNLNLLARLNRALHADFDLDRFRHEAVFNAREARIEMYLHSTCAQTVHIGNHLFQFSAGEPLLTEYSHKYTLESFSQLAREAGLRTVQVWTDAEQLFSVQYLEPATA